LCEAAVAPRMQLTDAGLGLAGVISLADPVELPNGNKTELCHARHVTLAPFSFPLDRCPSLYDMSRPVEVYFYSNPPLLRRQGYCITTTSHSRQRVDASGSESASYCVRAFSFDHSLATLQRDRLGQTQSSRGKEPRELVGGALASPMHHQHMQVE
jgi:hypothetical protein